MPATKVLQAGEALFEAILEGKWCFGAMLSRESQMQALPRMPECIWYLTQFCWCFKAECEMVHSLF